MKTTEAKFYWKPFSNKSLDFMANSNYWINIAVGSIRSSKTITVLTRFIEYMIQSENTEFMIIGKTLNTLELNVVRPLVKMLNTLNIHVEQNGYLHEIYFLNNTISLFGAGKKGDDEKIQGSTFGGTLIDEGTVITEDSFKMILSRNSLPNSCIFITCNPANPHHYLYKEYIDNTTLTDENKCHIWTFILEDNLTLTKEYIDNLKSSYPKDSLFYKRYILGKWVTGQGAIYPQFTKQNIYTEDKPLSYYDYVELGNDYGASSTTCWNLIGIKEFDDHTEFDVIDEGGYNAELGGVSLTDAEIVEMILEMQNKYELTKKNIFYPSHDATSLETELEKNPQIKMEIEKFKPDTMKAIGEIGSLFYKNHLRVHQRCKRTIECIESYEWDANAAKKGEDKPHKVDDHFCDSLRAPIMNHLYADNIIGGLVELG